MIYDYLDTFFFLFFFDISPAIHDMMGWYGMVWDGIDGLIWNI